MPDRVLPRRLSALDALFLSIEGDEAPLHIGGVDILDGDVPAEAFAARLETRLHETPRYLQRVVPAPLGLGHPVWEDDAQFDVRRHVLETRLDPPGNEAQLEACTSRLFSTRLDRRRPLWELHVIRALEGGRTAMLWKIHHCMVDGVSGVELLNIVFDLSPDGVHAPTSNVRTPPPAPATTLVGEALWDAGAQLVQAGAAIAGSAASVLESYPDVWQRLVERTRVLASAASRPVVRLPFNRPLSGGRRLAWSSFPLDELESIASAAGGTVNDVSLAVLTDAIGRLLADAGVPVRSRWLRILVPVNLRTHGEANLLGNRVTMVPVEVRLAGDPMERLRLTVARTRALKRARVAQLVDLVARASELVPAALHAAALSLASSPSVLRWSAPLRAAPFLVANMVCTNVPGPAASLYALGSRVVAHYPLVPLGFETGLNCALLTYNHALYVGLVADSAAIDDLAPLKAHLQAAFRAVRDAAGINAPTADDDARRAGGRSTRARRSRRQQGHG